MIKDIKSQYDTITKNFLEIKSHNPMNLAQHIKSKPKTRRPITSKPYFKSNYSQYSLNDPYAANDF